ncbi:hypothetical protein BABINDRAFT_160403 [Babjeviella inositovora NRRL Y-12698]|uniref:Brix domain-containing protein n=1 Tax=Babjeviella inositovora NRRL Y-12698 TaxID=984486 RepID=A0A1E3QTH8_9ASCO|nr:uncharacterized protein BABINDRAFT_160403 [Babjeviella inositovora NRRL Y-12698]ODQ80978.1 hypothetical protein BABINDRAFT_160403 [Babjeviella inositovora NRRL Y-12698]
MKNHSLTQLVRDFRNVMQPHTAIKLRERKNNRLKDYIVMAGPLGVSHLMVFSQSDKGTTHLRIARMPKGPTITFKVANYSLCKDVRQILKTPKSVAADSSEFLSPPLLVLNGFTNPATAEPHEKVIITVLQNMFPAISPQSTKVNSIKRVLMINKDAETGEIDLRHYAIDTRMVEVSRNVKKLIIAKNHLHKKLPNLGKATDVSDLLLDPYANGGFTSESEIDDDAIVEIKSEVNIQANAQANSQPAEVPTKKRAVKLTELGPRMQLELVKIEEGTCTGKILHHARITKTAAEVNKLASKHAKMLKLKAERKRQQEANVKAKKAVKEAKKLRRKERIAARENGEAVSESEDEEMDSENEIQINSEDYSDVSDLYSDNE